MKIFSIFSVLGIMGAVLVFGFLPSKGLAQETLFEEGEQEQEEFVDPREIKDALRQLGDVKRETQRVLKKAQKSTSFASEVSTLQTLLADLATHSNAIRNASGGTNQREALQEFYDAQLWDTVNEVRIKIEFPQELKNIERDLKRLEKLMASKRFSIEKVDIALLKGRVDEIKSALAEARSYFNEGNFEDARDALQVMYEGSHPGEIFGVVQQLKEVTQRLKTLKKEVREGFYEVLSPVYEAVNEGDFREANMMLNDIRNELWQLFERAKAKSVKNAEIQEKLQRLEENLQNKQQQLQNEEPVSGPQSYQPYQASVLGAVSNWLSSVFGW